MIRVLLQTYDEHTPILAITLIDVGLLTNILIVELAVSTT